MDERFTMRNEIRKKRLPQFQLQMAMLRLKTRLDLKSQISRSSRNKLLEQLQKRAMRKEQRLQTRAAQQQLQQVQVIALQKLKKLQMALSSEIVHGSDRVCLSMANDFITDTRMAMMGSDLNIAHMLLLLRSQGVKGSVTPTTHPLDIEASSPVNTRRLLLQGTAISASSLPKKIATSHPPLPSGLVDKRSNGQVLVIKRSRTGLGNHLVPKICS